MVGTLEQRNPRLGSPTIGSILQREGVGELPQDKISQKNGRQPKAYDHFHSINNDGRRKNQVLEPWLKGWSFGFISSEGHSGGLIIA